MRPAMTPSPRDEMITVLATDGPHFRCCLCPPGGEALTDEPPAEALDGITVVGRLHPEVVHHRGDLVTAQRAGFPGDALMTTGRAGAHDHVPHFGAGHDTGTGLRHGPGPPFGWMGERAVAG